MAPRLAAERHDERLQHFFRGLLCGERRPLVSAGVECVARVGEIARRLVAPIRPPVHDARPGFMAENASMPSSELFFEVFPGDEKMRHVTHTLPLVVMAAFLAVPAR